MSLYKVLSVTVRRSHSIAYALVGAALMLVTVGETASAVLYKWPGRQIRVCDRSGYARNVGQAISWWNRTPSRVHLYRSCRAPHITVRRYFERNPNVAGRGQYPPGGRVILNHYWMRKLPRTQRSDTAAHELGHALGLPHLRGCALMFKGGSFGPNCHAPSGRDPCGPQRHDVRALIRRYGGRLGDFRGFHCPDSPYN